MSRTEYPSASNIVCTVLWRLWPGISNKIEYVEHHDSQVGYLIDLMISEPVLKNMEQARIVSERDATILVHTIRYIITDGVYDPIRVGETYAYPRRRIGIQQQHLLNWDGVLAVQWDLNSSTPTIDGFHITFRSQGELNHVRVLTIPPDANTRVICTHAKYFELADDHITDAQYGIWNRSWVGLKTMYGSLEKQQMYYLINPASMDAGSVQLYAASNSTKIQFRSPRREPTETVF